LSTDRASDRFWERPLHTLDRSQWEALCDGCGKCCLHKLEDEETGDFYMTNVACRLLDRRESRCSDYKHRFAHVPDCIRLTPAKLRTMDWLPETCAYVLRGDNQPLPEWHYLISGSRDTVHEARMSTRGWTISEVDAGPLEDHIVEDV
jgi:uncharacterized protein